MIDPAGGGSEEPSPELCPAQAADGMWYIVPGYAFHSPWRSQYA